MRVKLLSRASDLARLQALLVGRALSARFPGTEITYLTRVAAGDRDVATPLSALVDQGAFPADLSEALAAGGPDATSHSCTALSTEPVP